MSPQAPSYTVDGKEKGIDRIRLMTVGISEYKHSQVNNLNEAANDAAKFRSLWDNTFIGINSTFIAQNYQFQLHLTNQLATRDSMLFALDHVFGTDENPLDTDDVAIFYYSGHGTAAGALTTYDTHRNPNAKIKRGEKTPLQSTTLDFEEEIVQRMQQSRASICIAILDCCYSGQSQDSLLPLYQSGYNPRTQHSDRHQSKGLLENTTADDIRVKVFDYANLGSRYMDDPFEGISGESKLILNACQAGKKAFEIRGKGGVLTHALTQALSKDRDKGIPFFTILEETCNNVNALTNNLGLRQTPTMEFSTSANFGCLPPLRVN